MKLAVRAVDRFSEECCRGLLFESYSDAGQDEGASWFTYPEQVSTVHARHIRRRACVVRDYRTRKRERNSISALIIVCACLIMYISSAQALPYGHASTYTHGISDSTNSRLNLLPNTLLTTIRASKIHCKRSGEYMDAQHRSPQRDN